eukprot:TRINITY_DN1266_c0_g1_i1.p1 TRINITY_DN1266_c0_g1~~TRINITY_DN1266_c0_g1_i1.p1  ORF type:complete len:1065 (-),score=200.15 TRINITY_DN1266_c0_g1_i1:131-3325(-)
MSAATVQVIEHVHGLHRDFANTQAHSEWLLRFQQTPNAWTVSHELITTHSEEIVQYFASHTIVSKLQAGQLPPDCNVLRNELFNYLFRFKSGPASVRRQLVACMVDCQLWQAAAQDGPWLSDSVNKLSESNEAVCCLLELLAVIPEEAANRKVMVTAQRRSEFASSMLPHTQMVLQTLWTAAQVNESSAVGALKAASKWLHLQHANPTLRAQKKLHGRFCADLVRQGTLQEHPLLQRAAQVLAGICGSSPSSLELCRACGDMLSEAQALTNEVDGPARNLILLIIDAVVTGFRPLLPLTQVHLEKWMDRESELSARAAVLARLVSELGGAWARLAVAESAAATPQLGDLADIGRHFVVLRHTDLARCGLDFWYQALSVHLGADSIEDDPYDDEAQNARPGAETWASSRDPEAEALRRSSEKPKLAPYIEKMVQAHWQAVRYPPEPELEEHFEWDEFVRFRENCSINITEACLVVTPRWIIEMIGGLLEDICQRQPIQWQDIDACVFVLTGVASRAPAGQDTVIPKLIELLPQLPYPTDGFKALLLRCAASRLILFTSGYLALNAGPCKEILKFLALQHLPAILPLKQAPDPDAKKYCEAIACDALKMVMTAARKTIVSAEGGTLWKDVVTAVIGLVADSRFNVDCRAQMVFAIGQVLSVLEDWNELEQMLSMFVSKMEEPILPILKACPAEPLGSRAVKQTRDGKAPLELKLYLASVSSVYNMPPRAESLQPPDHHPVLAVVERHFATIERVCIHHTQYDELMEQVCLAFSYILGFSREYAPKSRVFVPMMKLMARCCEFHPQPYYMGLVRSVIGFFAAMGSDELDQILVDLTGLFILPVAKHLVSQNSAQPLPPQISAAAYEMLAEAVRHWNLSLLGVKGTQWMPEVMDCTIEALPQLAEAQVLYEKTICAMMRFVRNILLWGDPETARGDNSPELVELQNQAQALMSQRPLPRGIALPRVIVTMARLLAAAAPNNPARGEVVPTVAEILRTLFIGPFEFVTAQQLEPALRSLPPPLSAAFSEQDMLRLVQQLKMEKGDSRRFTKTVLGIAEHFAVCLKKTQI